jgi:hypothetical protein
MANSPFSRGSDNHKPIYGGGDYYNWNNHTVGGSNDLSPAHREQLGKLTNPRTSNYSNYPTPENPHGFYAPDDFYAKGSSTTPWGEARGGDQPGPSPEQGSGGVRVPRNPLPMRPSGGMSLSIPR